VTCNTPLLLPASKIKGKSIEHAYLTPRRTRGTSPLRPLRGTAVEARSDAPKDLSRPKFHEEFKFQVVGSSRATPEPLRTISRLQRRAAVVILIISAPSAHASTKTRYNKFNILIKNPYIYCSGLLDTIHSCPQQQALHPRDMPAHSRRGRETVVPWAANDGTHVPLPLHGLPCMQNQPWLCANGVFPQGGMLSHLLSAAAQVHACPAPQEMHANDTTYCKKAIASIPIIIALSMAEKRPVADLNPQP
jgi:hypothetical protein